MSIYESMEEVSWEDVRKEWKPTDADKKDTETYKKKEEAYNRLTFFSNYFMKKGLYDLRDVAKKDISDIRLDCIIKEGSLYEDGVRYDTIREKAIAFLIEVAKRFEIPVNLTNEEIERYQPLVDEVRKVLYG